MKNLILMLALALSLTGFAYDNQSNQDRENNPAAMGELDTRGALIPLVCCAESAAFSNQTYCVRAFSRVVGETRALAGCTLHYGACVLSGCN